MSLLVWLPLNGNLNNYGLADVSHTAGTPQYKTPGKISNNALDLKTRIYFSCEKLANLQTFSVAFWALAGSSSSLTTNWLDLIGFSDVSSSGTAGTFRWETTYASQTGIHWHDNTTNAFVNSSHNHITVKDVWVHCCVVFNNELGKIYSYDNGVLKLTDTHLGGKFNSTGTFYLGETNNIEGMILDVRFYDHALSAKEVEEIAKGLVLHYKLDNNGLGNPNLLRGANIVGSSTVYGWIANGSATNIENIDGLTIHYKYNLSNSKNVPSITTNTVVPCEFGKTYMYSMDLKFDKDINLGTSVPMHYWVGARNTDSITNTNCNGHLSGILTHFILNHSGSLAANTWVTIQTTFTFPAAATEEGYDYPAIRGFVYGAVLQTAYTGEVNVWMKNCKIEEGEAATPWCPYKEDNIIYDSSGYNNNGTIVGSLEIITSSPRYSCATHIPATSSKIHISNFLTSGFSNSYSFAWWGKRNSNGPMFWGFSDGIRLNGMYLGNLWNTGDSSNNPLYKIGTTTLVSAPSVNVWHHYVMVGNGSKCYVYLDGELWAEAKTYKAISGTSIYINGWDAGTSYCSDNTDISDFRIYATALTAELVKELYNTSMTIDNLGNIHARELVE